MFKKKRQRMILSCACLFILFLGLFVTMQDILSLEQFCHILFRYKNLVRCWTPRGSQHGYVLPNHSTVISSFDRNYTFTELDWTRPAQSCPKFKESVYVTNCSKCVRPGVHQLEGAMLKIGFTDRLIPDQPTHFFTPKKEKVQELVQDYFIEPVLRCPYLLVLQPSVPHGRLDRDTVRQTWGTVSANQTWPHRRVNSSVKVIFVVGLAGHEGQHKKDSSTSRTPWEDIESEALTHQDILGLNMLDSYRNLTLKLLSSFQWVRSRCPCVQFVLKADFDTFVNVPLVVDTLLVYEKRLEFAILGMVYQGRSVVMRAGGWGVNRALYPMSSFPEYASGCGYVLSMAVLNKLLDTVPYFSMFAVEDAFITGVMRRVIACDLFSLGNMMTHHSDKFWHPCAVVEDKKLLVMTPRGERHRLLWNTVVADKC